ncbi:MAG: septum formation initiator family protein [Gemmatimonadota bacterium]
MTSVRWAAIVIVVIAVIFAWEGGEYSTGNWWTLRRDAARERAAVASLKAALDSLKGVAAAVERDPAEQERIAREEFGMIRRGEYLYRLVGPDSAER